MQRFLTVCAAAIVLLAGCSKKAQLPPVAEWEQFNDQFFRVAFTAPKGWEVQKDQKRVTITSSVDAMQKFFDPYSKNPAGAQLVISGERSDSVTTLDAIVAAYKQDLTESGYQIMSTANITIDSLPAVEITYGGRFDEQTALKAVRAYAYKDTTVYYVHFGGFNEYYEPYRAVYDSAVRTLVLPKPVVHGKGVDPSLPSERFETFSNDAVEFVYPDNFSPSVDKPSKEVQFAMTIKGYRQDCFITIDSRPAKGLKLEKVVEQNSKNFKSASKPFDAKVGGETAKYLTYVPTKGVDGRVYFVVKNDTFHRIIMIYATAMKKDFLPAFEKTVASMKLK